MTNKYKSFSTISSKATSSGVLYDMDVIMEDILSLLMTRKGDYPCDNNIGCIVHNYVFDPSLNDDEKAEIKEDLIEQLSRDTRLSNITVNLEIVGEGIVIAIYADVNSLSDQLFMSVSLKELAQYG